MYSWDKMTNLKAQISNECLKFKWNTDKGLVFATDEDDEADMALRWGHSVGDPKQLFFNLGVLYETRDQTNHIAMKEAVLARMRR